MKTFSCATGLAVAVSALGFAAPAAAQYAANNFLDATHPFSVENYAVWAERVAERTNGSVVFEAFLGGVLLGGRNSLSGTTDGVAQVAYHAGTYTPAELPITNVISELAFLTDNFYALAAAHTIMGFTHPLMLEEYASHGVVWGGGYGTPIYYLICREPISSLADLQGKRLRMPGAIWDRWATEMGAVSVNVPSSEIYTGLDRGTLDCGVNPLDSLLSRSYWDVAKYIPDIPLGSYYSGPMWVYNQDFWRSRTDEERAIMLEEAGAAFIRSAVVYLQNTEDALRIGQAEHGVSVVEPDAELMARHEEFVREDAENLLELAQTAYGVTAEQAEDLISTFIDLVNEWEEILEGVDWSDEERLTELFVERIYKQVDPSTHGM